MRSGLQSQSVASHFGDSVRRFRPIRNGILGCLLILLAAAMTIDRGLVLSDDAVESVGDTTQDDVQDILLLGPLEPSRLRLRIEIEGAPFKQAWRDAFNRLFDQFDNEHLGLLTPDKANRLAAVFGAGTGALAGQFPGKSMEQMAAGLSRDELATQLEKIAPPLRLVQKLSTQGAGPALVPLLDANGDGRLSRDELGQASGSLHCRDFNDDQLITDQELIAGPTAGDSTSSNDSTASNGSVIVIDRSFDTTKIAEVLLARYDRNRDGTISLKAPVEVQCLAGSLAKLDLDGDSILTRNELRGYLDLPVDVDLPFVLGGAKSRQKPVAAGGYRLREKRLINGYRLHVGSMEINFGYKKSDPNQDDTRPRMRDFDNDKNNYLDVSEFGRVPDAPEFAAVDANRDEKVTESELESFFQNRMRAISAQTLLDVTEQGSDFFRTLDQNTDRVLTPRELLSSPVLLDSEDRNHDGFIDGNEMAFNLDLMLMRGTPNTQRNVNQLNRRNPPPRVKADRIGPTWFQKLDRNRDGDVSLQEFPGNRQAFLKIDINGDGLISANEAEAITTLAK